MINLDFDNLDILRFEAKMKAYPNIIAKEFIGLITRITFLGERGIKEAIRSGETRAFDTGNLMNLIGSQIKSGFSGEIISAAPYSLYVHSGTSRMRARPYMTKGLENSVNGFNNLIEDFLNKVFNN